MSLKEQLDSMASQLSTDAHELLDALITRLEEAEGKVAAVMQSHEHHVAKLDEVSQKVDLIESKVAPVALVEHSDSTLLEINDKVPTPTGPEPAKASGIEKPSEQPNDAGPFPSGGEHTD